MRGISLRNWDNFVTRISLARYQYKCLRRIWLRWLPVTVWCFNVFLRLEYRFTLFGAIGNLYCFSLYSITYFTGILGQLILHFEIVPMSRELCTNVASTFTRNALTSKYVSMLPRRLWGARRLFMLISHYACPEGPAGGAVQLFVLQ